MRATHTTTTLLLLLALTLCYAAAHSDSATTPFPDGDPLFTLLLKSVEKAQAQHNVSESPITAYKVRGLFESHVHVNFVGDPVAAALRDLDVSDVNSLATTQILQVMLEAGQLSTLYNSPEPFGLRQSNVTTAVDALVHEFTQRSESGVSTSPLMNFWPELYSDGGGDWRANPPSLSTFLNESENIDLLLIEYLSEQGFSALEKVVAELLNDTLLSEVFLSPPADFASTLSSVALYYTLQYTSYDSAMRVYEREGVNMTVLRDAIVASAYTPFSTNNNTNTIDPRSFYLIREYLYDVKEAAARDGTTANVSVIATYASNVAQNKASAVGGISMPYNINTLDARVCADALYTLTLGSLSNGSAEWFDSQLQGVYADTADLLTWIVENSAFTDRPDLAAPRFPSIYGFYWSLSRTALAATLYPETNYTSVGSVLSSLAELMQGDVTNNLISMAKREDGFTFWDDFIGDSDTKFDGKADAKGSDRLYSTALAVTTLMNTWCVVPPEPQNCPIQWSPFTPPSVTEYVNDAMIFLSNFALSSEYAPYNSYAASSSKGVSLPLFFPANIVEYLNGSAVDPQSESYSSVDLSQLMSGVSGVISDSEYKDLLKDKWFGVNTPQSFDSLNDYAFPFWSSTPLTHAHVLAAFVKYDALLQVCGYGGVGE